MQQALAAWARGCDVLGAGQMAGLPGLHTALQDASLIQSPSCPETSAPSFRAAEGGEVENHAQHC